MKKFKFRLQRVLDYRNLLKKEKERVLARRAAELHDAQERLTQILTAQDEALWPDRMELTMAELALTGDYKRYLQDLLVRQRLIVLQAAEAVEAARQAYVEQAIETKTLENVKERRFRDFKEDERRGERRELDRFTVTRYRFKSKLSGKGEHSGGANG